ncbi:probable tubulin polyglutamylase TTLL1 [Nilaparvata lugens]|uniref:probable tubulin polyglutamylase TTLL1 n=1 Tax=Nilaparvata lugens TaxID=108931 RepID=UPI00193EB0D8|nr:probable tubulin polyglutamylase TTLL1 [Nilaparvata lugens]
MISSPFCNWKQKADTEYTEKYEIYGDLACKQQKKVKRQKVKYCIDVSKSVLTDNFEERKWIRVSSNDDWNFFWATSSSCQKLFSCGSRYRFSDHQIVNHFPNYFELTRKDALSRNMRRYRKAMEKSQLLFGVKLLNGKSVFLDFMPDTYILPADYSLLAEEFKRNPECKWIMKPCGRSSGSGIFLVDKLSQLRTWKKDAENNISTESYVISKYIENPLLIGGKKFDLRLYVLVTSFSPLKVYLFNHGFCRFCNVKYDTSVQQLDNIFIHLTNVSIQKQGEDYNEHHGGKWSTKNLRLYLESVIGKNSTEYLFDRITWLIVHSLKAVSPVIINDKHCFELYGYDIIIDNKFHPWLIEVNATPSLTSTTSSDRILKKKLIKQVIDLVLPPSGYPDCKWPKLPARSLLTDFQLLLDEEILEMQVSIAHGRRLVTNALSEHRSRMKLLSGHNSALQRVQHVACNTQQDNEHRPRFAMHKHRHCNMLRQSVAVKRKNLCRIHHPLKYYQRLSNRHRHAERPSFPSMVKSEEPSQAVKTAATNPKKHLRYRRFDRIYNFKSKFDYKMTHKI